MPGSETAPLYFIAAMMLLILIFSGGAVFLFVRQYKKEMREKQRSGKRKVKSENLEVGSKTIDS